MGVSKVTGRKIVCFCSHVSFSRSEFLMRVAREGRRQPTANNMNHNWMSITFVTRSGVSRPTWIESYEKDNVRNKLYQMSYKRVVWRLYSSQRGKIIAIISDTVKITHIMTIIVRSCRLRTCTRPNFQYQTCKQASITLGHKIKPTPCRLFFERRGYSHSICRDSIRLTLPEVVQLSVKVWRLQHLVTAQ